MDVETMPQWTPEQSLAINTVGGDLLLTASAGAGKTAVLSQRCLYLLADADGPCSVDELLVMTFTDAAAAEMRGRIADKLTDYVREHPHSSHLRRQIVLLDKAAISTVHAFCFRILREFFYKTGDDPDFEIMDANEAGLLKTQIAQELFEEYYSGKMANSSEIFVRFVQTYGHATGDRSLTELLIEMYDFLDTLTSHADWLASWQRELGLMRAGDLKNLGIVKQQKVTLLCQLGRVIEQANCAMALIDADSELDIYRQHVQEALLVPFQELCDVLQADQMDSAVRLLGEMVSFGRLPSKRGMDADVTACVKSFINGAKETAKKLAGRFAVSSDDVLKQMRHNSRYVDLLVEMYGEFSGRYQQAKRKLNRLDFSDLEHKCLELLVDDDGITDVARQLRDRFRYVLVDEYQDISPVQERIIQSISRGRNGDSGRPGNLFMVGDVKQSIYGFRQADPDIILGKYRGFEPVGADDAIGQNGGRIDLNMNFRSRRSVINGVNAIFSGCMTESFTGLDYRNAGRLVYGADYYDAVANEADGAYRDYPVELHLIERNLPDDEPAAADDGPEESGPDSKEATDATRWEAYMAARRIQQMMGKADDPAGQKTEFNVLDPDSKKLRPLRYRDIVILMRSMSMKAEVWSEVFHQMGIPVHAELSSGYFAAIEIQDMIAVLKLLDNPQQDIPLAAVLRGPMVGLNESQLTALRLHLPNGPYHVAVRSYCQGGADRELREKLCEFYDRLDQWRSLARGGRLADLVWTIYRETNLPAYVMGLPDGRQRHSNLLHLHDTARQFDAFSGQGLARFLRFVQKLRDQEGDFGPAPVLTETDDVVRIMSIHKSKGLEFPVVFVTHLNSRFNLRDTRGPVLFDRPDSCPVGLRVIDRNSRDSWATLAHHVIADNIRQRQMAEEMRILYVALTRARERLILTASVDLEKTEEKWRLWRDSHDTALPDFLLDSASSAIDWIGPVLAGHPDMGPLFDHIDRVPDKWEGDIADETSRFKLVICTGGQMAELLDDIQLRKPRETRSVDLDAIIKGKDSETACPEIQKTIDRLDWRYPHQSLTALGARAGVTELKRKLTENYVDFQADSIIGIKRGDLEGEEAKAVAMDVSDFPLMAYAETGPVVSSAFSRRPGFMAQSPEPSTAPEIGTWTHLLLEKLDLDGRLDVSGLAGQLETLTQAGFFTPDQARAIDLEIIANFFTSQLGQDLLAHKGTLKREWAFTLAVGAGEVYREADLSGAQAAEPVIVRGVIDALYQGSDGLVIVDYKTDNIDQKQLQERGESYRFQMEFYRRAVGDILGGKIAGQWLYFLKPGLGYQVSAR